MQRPENPQLDAIDARITSWMARNGIAMLRFSLGAVFLWFGALKFVPGLSPADALAGRTIEALTFGAVPPSIAVPILATWECLIGLGLLTRRLLRATLLLLGAQMAGTLAPLVLFPSELFFEVPWAPTLEGQYILKNSILISAAIVIGATVRGGGIVPRPSKDLASSKTSGDRT